MVILTLRIVSIQRNIGVAIAWIAILYTLPLVGLIAYLLVGEPTIGRRYRERMTQARLLMNDMAARERLVFDQGEELLDSEYRGVSRIGTLWTGFGVLSNQEMRLLASTDAVFESLIEDIDNAQSRILMEFYIIYPKGRVLEVVESLITAAKRGGECHILADSVGSFSFFGSQQHKAL